MLQTNEKNTNQSDSMLRLSGATLMMGGGLALTAGNASADELFDYCGETVTENLYIVDTDETTYTSCHIYVEPYVTVYIRNSYIHCAEDSDSTSEKCLNITGDVYSRLVVVNSTLDMNSSTGSTPSGLDFDFNAKGGRITIDDSTIITSFGNIYADAGIFITASDIYQESYSTSLSLYSENGPVEIKDSMFYLNYELDAATGWGNGKVRLLGNEVYDGDYGYLDVQTVGGQIDIQHNWGDLDDFYIYSDTGYVYLYRNNIDIKYNFNIMTFNSAIIYNNNFNDPISYNITARRCIERGNDENYC